VRKRSQRERLLNAMTELAAEQGFHGVRIAQVSSRAGVSMTTFYEQFDDKEDCMVAAYGRAAELMLAPLARADNGDWCENVQIALRELLLAVQRDTDAGRVVMIEGLVAGPRLRAERKRVVHEFERRAQALLERAPTDGYALDIPTVAVIGAVRSIISRQLRSHAEDRLPLIVGDIVRWMTSFARPAGKERWSTGPRALLPAVGAASASGESQPRARELARLPRGRHGLPANVVARSQRTRIMYAVAEVTMAKGYADTTITDIVASAGVAREVFYEHFTDKQHAFLEAQQHPIQHLLDTCVAAYFRGRDWPERVWNALRTVTELIASNPAMAHLRIVECYAAGPAAIRRAEEITRSFTMFWEEGYHYRPQAANLPRLYSQAIAGAIFEIIQRQVARGDGATLTQRLPQLTYLALAPFTGAEQAIQLLERMSAASATADAPNNDGAEAGDPHHDGAEADTANDAGAAGEADTAAGAASETSAEADGKDDAEVGAGSDRGARAGRAGGARARAASDAGAVASS
jgi:AcrR family transcriptional regulator